MKKVLLIVATIIGTACSTSKNRTAEPLSPAPYITRNGDVIMTNNHNGRADAAVFYEHVFATNQDRPRVCLYTHFDNPPRDFKGIYIFLDAEAISYLRRKDKITNNIVYIGQAPVPTTAKSKKIYVPYASLGFTERTVSPLALLAPREEKTRPYFAAYLVSNCMEKERQDYYDELVDYAKANNLGPVHALGKCFGTHPETKIEGQGRGTNYLNEAIKMFQDYQFVLSFENGIVPGYVSEKIISPFLAGAIPIYFGDEMVNKIFNPKSFVYVKSGDRLADVLSPFIKNKDLWSETLRQPIFSDDSALYLFSWHRDIAKLLASKGQKTLVDSIYEAISEIEK